MGRFEQRLARSLQDPEVAAGYAEMERKMASDQEHRYMDNVLAHKTLVGRYINKVIGSLMEQAVVHDNSKFGIWEFEPYAEVQDRFATAEYGSEEYLACCEAIKPALKHHVTVNAHHPESFANGINDMSLLEVVEMVCDWCAACQRSGGDTLRLDLQKARFTIDDQLYGIIVNTARRLLADSEIKIIS